MLQSASEHVGADDAKVFAPRTVSAVPEILGKIPDSRGETSALFALDDSSSNGSERGARQGVLVARTQATSLKRFRAKKDGGCVSEASLVIS